MKRILEEPLLHFVLLGAALFAGYGLLNGEPARDPQQIVVSAGQIEHLLDTFVRTWQRQPTEQEVKGLVDQYVREEVLSREAIKLGLDENDTVIRRRLQQKMEFIADDLAAATEPTEADLATWYAQHPEEFREEPRLTFRQIYLSREKHGDQLDPDALRLLERVKTDGPQGDVSATGDPSLLPPSLADEPQAAVAGMFGKEFARTVAELPLGEWSGPIRTDAGAHLVFVERRTEGEVPPLVDIRDAVRREWENFRRVETNRQFLEGLLEQYRVTIEWPKQPEKVAMTE